MKKNKYFLSFMILLHFISFAQENNVIIKYSVKKEKSLGYREKVIDGETIVGYAPTDTVFFKNKLNLKLYFIDDKIFLKNQLISCFKNVQYYESLIFMSVNNKEYLYVYPHYYGRVGPYIWYGLGILIEIKKTPIVKENIDYFDDYELDQVPKFKNYKLKKIKGKICK
jgi:hypothetical protein